MKKGLLIIPALLILASCGGSSKQNNPTPIIPATPAKASLSLPAQNAVCTSGTIISATESSITFSWGVSGNTDSYDLSIKNLLTSAVTTQNTTQTQATVTLSRNTPYSWYIVSKSTQTTTTTQSDTWKFYNSGPGVVTYAPFPADITAPTFGQTVTGPTVNLTWTGSDATPDQVASYDVYFGTTSSPAILKSTITDSFVNSVSVTANQTYYWKVVTRDINGNTSDSGLYQFTVN
jgi:hypothetical protein